MPESQEPVDEEEEEDEDEAVKEEDDEVEDDSERFILESSDSTPSFVVHFSGFGLRKFGYGDSVFAEVFVRVRFGVRLSTICICI